jgi:hypothetical protein
MIAPSTNNGAGALTILRSSYRDPEFRRLRQTTRDLFRLIVTVYMDAVTHEAYPGRKRLCDDLGMKPTAVKDACRELRAAGFMEVVGAPSQGRATTFRIVFPRGRVGDPVEDAQGRHGDPVNARGRHGDGTGSATRPTTPYEHPRVGCSETKGDGGRHGDPVRQLKWPHVTADDLRTDHRVDVLYKRALNAGLFQASEDTLQTFYSAVEHSLHAGDDPGALLSKMIFRWPALNANITAADDRRGHERLRKRIYAASGCNARMTG